MNGKGAKAIIDGGVKIVETAGNNPQKWMPMLKEAGLGIAYHAKPVVAQAAGAAINHNDLTALLYLQGYADDEIVTAF